MGVVGVVCVVLCVGEVEVLGCVCASGGLKVDCNGHVHVTYSQCEYFAVINNNKHGVCITLYWILLVCDRSYTSLQSRFDTGQKVEDFIYMVGAWCASNLVCPPHH